jgi:hypothetical protein
LHFTLSLVFPLVLHLFSFYTVFFFSGCLSVSSAVPLYCPYILRELV